MASGVNGAAQGPFVSLEAGEGTRPWDTERLC